MLRHTFCHLPGVGESTERRLWARGLTTWDAALADTRSRLPADHLRASAVLLWADYRRPDDAAALEPLLAYNVQDVLNLEVLMVEAHNRKLAGLAAPFAAAYRLPPPLVADSPFRPDPAAVARTLRARR